MHEKVRGLSCKPTIYVSWSTSKLRVRLAPWNRLKPSIKILTYFYWRSNAVLLLWTICVISVSCFPCFSVCSLLPCGHLPGKWNYLLALVCDVYLCFCHFPKWYPGSGVMLDCIDSWSLSPFLLLLCTKSQGLWSHVLLNVWKLLSLLCTLNSSCTEEVAPWLNLY